MISSDFFRKYYPNDAKDGTICFYKWIRQAINSKMRILNLGAGPATNDKTRILKGEVLEIVGADPDPVVLDNPELDRAVVLSDQKLPFSDANFDLVFSDFVLEHVENPSIFLNEIGRVLKLNGSFFFRTRNTYHYVPILSRITPHWFHHLIANRARGLEQDAHEPWPTFYLMNTRARLKRLTQESGFRDSEFRMIEAEPSYLMFHTVPFLMGVAYERMVNSTEWLAGLRVNILGRLTK